MAAFIQKLFNRKKAVPTKPVEPSEPTTNQLEKVERQDERRQQQLRQLKESPSQSDLESLAIYGSTADIRLRAAKALTDKETLQRVQKQAKSSDKGVYQIIRQTLQTLREREAEQQRQQDAIATLIRNAQDQARSEDTKLFQPRLDALLQHWAKLESQASETQAAEFRQAVDQCRARLETINAEKARQAQSEEQKNQRAETLALLRATIADLKQPTQETEPSIASLDALQKTQENRWMEATRDTEVAKQEQKDYEGLMLPLRGYIAAIKRLGQNRDALQALISENPQTEEPTAETLPSADELLSALDWPAEFPMPPMIQQLAKQAGKKPIPKPETANSEEQKAYSETLHKTLEKLEQALEAQQLKESKQLFKTAQQQFKQLNRRHGEPVQAKLQLLGGQLRELADWQGFATRPKQIALCEQMEYLADQPMDPEAKATRIKELQNEWRELGGSSDRELWARFKQASDKAFEPCKEYFSAKSGLKQANLDARKTIVEQLRTFIDSADWQGVDWKAVERIHQKAREEWKAAWPIEFKDNRPVQKAFDGLLKQLEHPLNEERQKNEALKQGIVERAEALVAHESLTDAMDQAKKLQSEWQQIGITRHREDRKLWQAFRNACDQIFARRDAAKHEQQAQTQAADEQAAAVLEQSGQQDEQQTIEALANQVIALEAFEDEPLSTGLHNKMRLEVSRLKSLIQTQRSRRKLADWQHHIQSRVNGIMAAADLPDHWPTLAAQLEDASAAELIIRAEILAQTASPADEQSQRMEIQVQRLADGMNGNGSDQDALMQMEMLVAAWCLRPEDDSVDQARADRLAAALETAVSQHA